MVSERKTNSGIDPPAQTARSASQAAELVSLVRDAILEANGSRWPTNLKQWRATARRFGLSIAIARVDGPFRALLVDDLIIVRWNRDFRIMQRCIAHEVAEAAMRWEGAAPCVCGLDSMGFHHIATQVERQCVNETRGAR